ncbi:expressed unknown protein [Seminavis robusta]|uniref:Uncharacterized protein n=1 Tax=Seminavis robusta TaxID=568900 RepID=A0A9N8EMZ1_9STRA|nr:expressed unknown protein [Seminavis robusta]|eukprot:Sro1199_g251720.1 n/a (188) ;mRNA; r:11641-12204
MLTFWGGSLVTFLTTLDWSQLETAIENVVSEVEWWGWVQSGLSITAAFLSIYMTAGAALAVKITTMLPTVYSLFGNTIDFLENDCFGEITSFPCDNFQNSGGHGVTTSLIDMGQTSGTFTVSYHMQRIKDQMEVFYEDEVLYTTGGLVSGPGQATVSFAGESQLVTIVVSSPYVGTAWSYDVTCPGE